MKATTPMTGGIIIPPLDATDSTAPADVLHKVGKVTTSEILKIYYQRGRSKSSKNPSAASPTEQIVHGTTQRLRNDLTARFVPMAVAVELETEPPHGKVAGSAIYAAMRRMIG